MTEASTPRIGALQDNEPPKPHRSSSAEIWAQFSRHKGAMLGGGFLVFITAAVVVGPWLWGVDPQKLDMRNRDIRPIWVALVDGAANTSWARPFGTDNRTHCLGVGHEQENTGHDIEQKIAPDRGTAQAEHGKHHKECQHENRGLHHVQKYRNNCISVGFTDLSNDRMVNQFRNRDCGLQCRLGA